MPPRIREKLLRPFRHVLREMNAAGELDAMERRRVRQLMLSPGLCSDVCDEIEKIAKQHGMSSQLAGMDGGEGSAGFEALIRWVRENWLLVVQAILFVLPYMAGDDGESEASNEESES